MSSDRFTVYRPFLSLKYLKAWLFIASMYVFAYIPDKLQQKLANFMGVILFYLVRSRRKIGLVNIRLCFPSASVQQQQQLVKRCFQQTTLSLFRASKVWCRTKAAKRLPHRFINLSLLQQAQAQKQGVLLVGAHFGALDMAGNLLDNYAKMNLVYRVDNNPLLEIFIKRGRLRYAEHCYERKDIKGMIRCLRQGKTLWYAPDQDYGAKDSVFVPFFNIDTATITSTSRLAQLGRAQIIFTSYFYDAKQHCFVSEFFQPTFSDIKDPVAVASSYNQWLEQQIRRYPEQYLWLHKRFKTRPTGQHSFYK